MIKRSGPLNLCGVQIMLEPSERSFRQAVLILRNTTSFIQTHGSLWSIRETEEEIALTELARFVFQTVVLLLQSQRSVQLSSVLSLYIYKAILPIRVKFCFHICSGSFRITLSPCQNAGSGMLLVTTFPISEGKLTTSCNVFSSLLALP